MKNEQLERVADIFVGDWTVAITNQRWLDDKTATTTGIAKGEWLGDAFVQLRAWFEGDGNAIFGDTAVEQPDTIGQPALHFVFGRSDARDQFVALSHDERGQLEVKGASNGIRWPREGGDEAVALALVDRSDSPATADRVRDELVIVRDRERHLGGACFPKLSRPLDVGQEKRDRPDWQREARLRCQ